MGIFDFLIFKVDPEKFLKRLSDTGILSMESDTKLSFFRKKRH